MENKYKALLHSIFCAKNLTSNRTASKALTLYNQTLSFDITDYFPFITGRKLFFKNCLHEFIWFLSGDTNIKYLKENGVSIWDEWADEKGDLGPVYGKQLVDFNGVNQLDTLLTEIKLNPSSRRLIVSLWNPADLNQMALPVCYCMFQFHIEGSFINLTVYQRSSDAMLGLPYDMPFFALFLTYIAKETGYKPKNITIVFGNIHIYSDHIEAFKTYMAQPIGKLPTLIFNSLEDIRLENYNPGIFIKINKII